MYWPGLVLAQRVCASFGFGRVLFQWELGVSESSYVAFSLHIFEEVAWVPGSGAMFEEDCPW